MLSRADTPIGRVTQQFSCPQRQMNCRASQTGKREPATSGCGGPTARASPFSLRRSEKVTNKNSRQMQRSSRASNVARGTGEPFSCSSTNRSPRRRAQYSMARHLGKAWSGCVHRSLGRLCTLPWESPSKRRSRERRRGTSPRSLPSTSGVGHARHGGREPLEGVECPQLGFVLVTPGFMVRESEGHPAPATKFRVVSVDAVERERFEGVVEELLPTCLLAPGRLKQELIPESVQHQILDSDPQLGSAAAWALLAKLSTIVSTCLRMTDEPGGVYGIGRLVTKCPLTGDRLDSSLPDT